MTYTTTYTTVFDLAVVGFKLENYYPLAISGFFSIFGAAMIARRETFLFMKLKRPMLPKFPYFFFGFSVLYFVVVGLFLYSSYTEAQADLREGRTSVVEGRVTRFVPMPYTGHALESFCVKDACFSYSNYVGTPGFNNAASHGGPLHEGLPVRVTYVGNKILKLEVAPE